MMHSAARGFDSRLCMLASCSLQQRCVRAGFVVVTSPVEKVRELQARKVDVEREFVTTAALAPLPAPRATLLFLPALDTLSRRAQLAGCNATYKSRVCYLSRDEICRASKQASKQAGGAGSRLVVRCLLFCLSYI